MYSGDSMKVRVLFFGVLKDIAGAAERDTEMPDGATLGDLLDRCAGEFPRLAAMRGSIVLARNREFAGPETRLADSDEVAFLPPVSGGADDPIVEIVRAPIDARALAAALLRGRDGAVIVFEGVVRDNSGGRETKYLEYEAYEPMALAQMQALAAEARQKFQIDGIAIVHRLGRLEIGETSVAIVVTSAHRGAAFDACRFGIDKLKKTVPIWKKEHFADGAVWVEGDWDETLKNRLNH